jgi:hypothetical protein
MSPNGAFIICSPSAIATDALELLVAQFSEGIGLPGIFNYGT